MSNLYKPEQLGIKAPSNGFQQGGWYNGRQFWGGQFSDPGVVNPLSDQNGAGQLVSPEVNAQSAAAQGQSPQQLESYLQQQRNAQVKANVAPTNNVQPQGAGVAGGGDMGAGMGMTQASTLNLPELYKSLYKDANISTIEEELANKEKGYNDATSKINDNPYLSEANRTGRISKLTTDYNNSVKQQQDELAMKKADIETQLNLASKQFDIESQAAKQALDQFNTLLESGALSGATGSDIAAITRTTGISSSMVQSAINAQNQKNIKTNVTTVDDGKNIYSVVVNSQTGEVINKQVIGASKPTATGSANTPASANKNIAQKLITEADTIQGMNDADGTWIGQFPQIVAKYAPYMTLEEIYKYFMQSNLAQQYGTPTEDPKFIQNIYDLARGKTVD